MRVGILGVGTMGLPIAVALAEVHDVEVFDVDVARGSTAVAAGLRAAATAAELAGNSEVLITVLPGADEVHSALSTAAATLQPGSLWLDLSTGDPRVTDLWADSFADKGIMTVAAPMGGGPEQARVRALHFSVAGTREHIERVRDLLTMLSASDGVETVGASPRDAQVVKLLSNLLWFGQVVAVTEAMLLGRALGLEPARLRELLASRAGASVLLERDYPAVLEGNYLPTFGIDRVTAQLDVAASLAAEHSLPFELSSLVARTHRAAWEQFGPVGGELLAARLLEERAGEHLRSHNE